MRSLLTGSCPVIATLRMRTTRTGFGSVAGLFIAAHVMC